MIFIHILNISRMMYLVNLLREIGLGHFREDLYHRLSEIVLRIPSLGERNEDIPDLARHFLGRLHSNYSRGGTSPRLLKEGADLLVRLEYPGNIRQLVGILQGALFESTGGVIGEKEILGTLAGIRDPGDSGPDSITSLYSRLRRGEADFWNHVRGPFMAHEMTRAQVLEIYRMALSEGGGVREAAGLLRALPQEDREKALIRFRNFLYKTLGAGKDREEKGGTDSG